MFCFNIKSLEKMHIGIVSFLYALYFQCFWSQNSKIILNISMFLLQWKNFKDWSSGTTVVHQDLISSNREIKDRVIHFTLSMEKTVDIFCSTQNNSANFIHERQELFLQSPSLLWVLWHFSYSNRPWWGDRDGKGCCSYRKSMQLCFKCCFCLGDALPFCCWWVFLRWQRWVLSYEVSNPGRLEKMDCW